MANRKRLMLCFLENMKATELPKPPPVSEKTVNEDFYDSEQEEEVEVAIREDTARTGFKVPDRL